MKNENVVDARKSRESFSPNSSPIPGNYQKLIVRCFAGLAMILGFALIIYVGPALIFVFIVFLQLCCYREVINVGLVKFGLVEKRGIKTLCWAILVQFLYCAYGALLFAHFAATLHSTPYIRRIVLHHKLINFCAFSALFVSISLFWEKRRRKQYVSMFGMAIIVSFFITSGCFAIALLLQGFIWFILPIFMVNVNDMSAYFCGFVFGRTQLIRLSPKKTWEGYLGALCFTVLLGLLFASACLQFEAFLCPIEPDSLSFPAATRMLTRTPFSSLSSLSSSLCDINPIFIKRNYSVPNFLTAGVLRNTIFSSSSNDSITISWYPFWHHVIIIALFVSIIGPFAGFMASGFKRAFKVKDFASIIPGHGGVMDRMDCEFFAVSFVAFYFHSFIAIANPSSLLRQAQHLSAEEQLQLHHAVRSLLFSDAT